MLTFFTLLLLFTGWNVRGTLISNRYIQFETFVESGSCDDGACYVNPYRLNANAASAPKTGSSRLLRRTLLEFHQCEDLSYHGDVMYPNLDVVFMANDEGVDLFTAQAFRKMCEVEENIMGQTNWNNYCKGGAMPNQVENCYLSDSSL